jgi:2'-5' RNA ligase
LLPDAASRAVLVRGRDGLDRAATGTARGMHWIEPDALHLTLRFLGPSGNAQIDYLAHMLPTLAGALPTFATRRYGVWPNRARPRLLVLELEPDPTLSALARACEDLARKLDYSPDPRDFRAHVTLARLRPGRAFGILPKPPATMGFDAVALMQSHPARPAASYRELARVPVPRANT